MPILGIAGVMSMDCRTACVTVRVVLPVFPDNVALTVVEPAATDVAKPSPEPMVAIAGSDELHATCAVRSWTVLSVKIPVAVNCVFLPSAMLGLVGVTPIDASVAEFTVRVVLPVIPENIALTVVGPVEPAASDVARPLEPASLLTEATEGSDVVHVANEVRSRLVLSE